ncbi:MAG: DUF1732 domain-containing protein [Asticcacaulis sp.]
MREELDRLASHIAQAHSLIDGEAAPGASSTSSPRNSCAEANTLCSKSALHRVDPDGLELKSVIDQFREQVQNVE